MKPQFLQYEATFFILFRTRNHKQEEIWKVSEGRNTKKSGCWQVLNTVKIWSRLLAVQAHPIFWPLYKFNQFKLGPTKLKITNSYTSGTISVFN